MELLQLKYFCHAAETQNFSKSASAFLVPPSNISQSIKRLEAELETPLFTRQANKVRLNEAGTKFYEKAQQALALLDTAREEAKQVHSAAPLRINIQINRRIVMEVVEQFQAEHPDVAFVTTHAADTHITDYDMVITDKELDTAHTKHIVKEEQLFLAYNKDTFRFDSSFDPQQLKSCPFITMSSGNSIYDYTQKICAELGFQPRIVLESEDPYYIRKCIELGLGVAIVPEFSWRGQFADNTALRSIGDYKRNIYVYQKDRGNKQLKAFYNMLICAFENREKA